MSKVFFKSVDNIGPHQTQIDQIKELFPKISPVKKGDIVAVKIHPGEYGNTTHIRPVIVRTVVDLIKEAGGIPFVTDTTVLYKGMRFNAVDLLWTAEMNGFTQGSMNAPIIVADGLRGDDSVDVEIEGEVLDSITVASAIAKADCMIMISHCKGHPGSGFGGAIKNLGMGCLDKDGKTRVHEVGRPVIDTEKCIGCGVCFDQCVWGALKMDGDKVYGDKAYVDHDLCKGELSCLESCPQEAIIPPEDVAEKMQMRLGEASVGPIKALSGRIGYINWIFDLTPGCDCFNFSAPVFSRNVGIVASSDPVALDMASIDLINRKMHEDGNCGGVHDVWGIDPVIHLEYAEKVGSGNRKYELVE
ncbi:MAG: DUF362 domain-containing protein [Methanosarcinaceae archaeon]|nr:DUF362 domain-containing protein [Methanosarcinaceae archaeon]